METYFYSAKDNIFYLASLKEQYDDAGTWPEVCVEVLAEDFKRLMEGQSENKVITTDESGRPILSDRIMESQKDLRKWAESKKLELMNCANAAIAPLQDAIDLGIATEEEATTLAAWKRYRVMLNRVDLSKAPFIWPSAPE